MPDNYISKAPGDTSRIEAQFSGVAYAAHAHDTYTLALTTQGVQSFNYRGSLHHSLPGEVLIIHPDEMHDGLAGTDEPFGYRAINIDPVHVQKILKGADLPFLADCVRTNDHFTSIAKNLLGDFRRPLEELEYQDIIFDFATLLQINTSKNIKHKKSNYLAMKLVKEYIDSSIDKDITLDKLSSISNYSKWQIIRDFRSLYGTSPYRYLTFRRLEKAKLLIEAKEPLSQVALDTNFSDQSHFTRQFKKCFGITPKAWGKLTS